MDIKKMRENSGLTQKELASKLGLSVMTIVRYESGEFEPRASEVAAMAELFNCSIDELFGKKRPFAKNTAKTKGKASLK